MKKQIGQHTVNVELEVLDTVGGEFAVAFPWDPTPEQIDEAKVAGQTRIVQYAQGNNRMNIKSGEDVSWWTTGKATYTF